MLNPMLFSQERRLYRTELVIDSRLSRGSGLNSVTFSIGVNPSIRFSVNVTAFNLNHDMRESPILSVVGHR